jgi:hypothetical protein
MLRGKGEEGMLTQLMQPLDQISLMVAQSAFSFSLAWKEPCVFTEQSRNG